MGKLKRRPTSKLKSKLQKEKPWAKLHLSRSDYEAKKPWTASGITRAEFEKLVENMPQEGIDLLIEDAQADLLVDLMFKNVK